MNIQEYSPNKVREIADLFYKSIHAIDSLVYTQEQKEAWAPYPIDYEYWSSRFEIKKPFLAIVEEQVVGFMELERDGHIDCTYTHPNYQGQGVATALYQYLLEKAKEKGINRLYVEASYLAKPFFKKHGFDVIKKNEVKRNGVVLVNFTMEKKLVPDNS